jgi:hypothetical protein
MVYVCQQCNNLKSDSTLTAFIAKEGRSGKNIGSAERTRKRRLELPFHSTLSPPLDGYLGLIRYWVLWGNASGVGKSLIKNRTSTFSDFSSQIRADEQFRSSHPMIVPREVQARWDRRGLRTLALQRNDGRGSSEPLGLDPSPPCRSQRFVSASRPRRGALPGQLSIVPDTDLEPMDRSEIPDTPGSGTRALRRKLDDQKKSRQR